MSNNLKYLIRFFMINSKITRTPENSEIGIVMISIWTTIYHRKTLLLISNTITIIFYFNIFYLYNHWYDFIYILWMNNQFVNHISTLKIGKSISKSTLQLILANKKII